MLRSRKDGLTKHQVREGDAGERAAELRTDVAWHVAPGEATLGSIRQGDRAGLK